MNFFKTRMINLFTITLLLLKITTIAGALTPTPSPSPPIPCSSCDMTIEGYVKDNTGNPIAGAIVSLLSMEMTTTNSQGYYQFTTTIMDPNGPNCPFGDTYIFINAQGFTERSLFIGLNCGNFRYDFILSAMTSPPIQPPTPVCSNCDMTPAPPPPTPFCPPCDMTIEGNVKDVDGNPIAGATVSLLSTEMATTNSEGYYQFTTTVMNYNCSIGDSYLYIKARGYITLSHFFGVYCGNFSSDFTLSAATPPPTPVGSVEATLEFYVYDDVISAPISGARVSGSSGTSDSAVTGSDGTCALTFIIHDTRMVSITVEADEHATYNDSFYPLQVPLEHSIGLNPTSITGSGSMWISPSTKEVSIGDNFMLEVRYTTSPSQDLAAYGIDIIYDASLLSVNTSFGTYGAEAGPDGFIAAVNNNNPGTLTVSGFDVDGKGPGTNLHLVTLHFTAGQTRGNSEVDILINTLSTSSYADIGYLYTVPGNVIITDILKGDINGDGSIDIIDALQVAQYYVGITPHEGFITEAADTNDDNKIDIVDALRIAQYYVGLISSL